MAGLVQPAPEMEPEPEPEHQVATAGGVLVWVTGWPGVGKSTVGDYLASECGFAHVDVDNDFMFNTENTPKDALAGWFKSWGAFFSAQPPVEADFAPFMRLVTDRVQQLRAAEPGRNIVVTQGIHRLGRDLARKVLGEGDISGLRFIGLTASHELNASRLLIKERRYAQLRGASLEDEFKERTKGEELTEASYLAEYMSQPKHSASNRKGMDTDEDEVGCDRIDIAVDGGAAVLPTVRSLLGLPALDGTIDRTAASEANWKKMEIAQPWAPAEST